MQYNRQLSDEELVTIFRRYRNFYDLETLPEPTLPTLPTNSTYSLLATSLTGLSAGAAVTSWGSFTQATSGLQPTYGVDSGTSLQFVRFTGNSTSRQFLQWNNTSTVNFGTNGGSTIVLFIRFRNSLTQFNRPVSHNGSSGNARVFEFILAENANAGLAPKYFFANNSAVIYSTASVPINKWTLIIVRFTNGTPNTAQIFLNSNTTTPVATNGGTLNALQNSTVTTYFIGSQGSAEGMNSDMHHVSYYPRSLSNNELADIASYFSSYIEP
jgi:hypothetical protein